MNSFAVRMPDSTKVHINITRTNSTYRNGTGIARECTCRFWQQFRKKWNDKEHRPFPALVSIIKRKEKSEGQRRSNSCTLMTDRDGGKRNWHLRMAVDKSLKATMISKPRPNTLAVSTPKKSLEKQKNKTKTNKKPAAQDAVFSSLWVKQQCLYFAGPAKITANHAGIQQSPWRQATPRKKHFCQTALSATDFSLCSHGNQPLPTGQNHQPPHFLWGGGGRGVKGVLSRESAVHWTTQEAQKGDVS